MAPLPPSLKKPSARTLRHQRITGQIHPLLPAKTFRADAAVSDDFLSTKRDKRLIKHSSFVSKISSTSRISKAKRRRPGNKLKANLEDLADALPELAEGEGQAELAGKIKHKSLRSRPGAMRRKEKVVRGEMDRFGVSMAKLVGTPGAAQTQATAMPAGLQRENDDEDDDEMGDQQEKPAQPAAAPPATANRWAALRGYISATMEQNPAFAGKN